METTLDVRPPDELVEKITPAELIRNRSRCVRLLLGWLCEYIEKATKVRAQHKYTMNHEGDVLFHFEPRGTVRYVATPEEIAAIAKECWVQLRAQFPRVFHGASYKKFIEQYESTLSAEELSALGDDDFAKFFQRQTK